MFIIGEGVLNGIIHLSNGGRFLGYFASNKVKLDLVQELQNFFFTDEQLENLGSRVPLTITNVFVDDDNIVYSTTMGQRAEERLAKHNTAGKNVFVNTGGAEDFIDVYVDKRGMVYAASLQGAIGIYSPEGEIIHIFGGFMSEEDVSGLFTDLASIAVDNDGKIWAADSTTSYIQSFTPTIYANLIYDALESFKLGQYEKAEVLWEEVLSKNQMLRLGHEGLGKVYLYTERYEMAMEHLKIANNKFFYSQAYWETRNIWLQKSLSLIIIGLIGLFILFKVLKALDKKYSFFLPVRNIKSKLMEIKVISDVMFIFTFIKHPINAFYDLKIKKRGSYLGSFIVTGIFFLVYLHSSYGRGFLFRPVEIEDVDFSALTLGFFAILVLFTITNYLVSSIQDGDGSLGEIFKVVAYSLGPILFGILAVTFMSYFLTYNEEFLIKFTEFFTPIWSGVLLVLGLQEIHNYTTRQSIKSILISLAFMIVIAIILLIIFIMGEQVYDFFEVIIREVIRNVFG